MWNKYLFHATDCLFHTKKFYSTYLFLIPHVIPRLERGIKHLWFYSTLVFFIPRWPVLFHTIPRKVWPKSQMLVDKASTRWTKNLVHLSPRCVKNPQADAEAGAGSWRPGGRAGGPP